MPKYNRINKDNMTKEEFIELLEEELDELSDATMNEWQRNHTVNGFYESYTQPSAAACSNLLHAVSDKEGEEDSGASLLITALQESKGIDELYIVSILNMATFETEGRKVIEGWGDVIEYAVEKWYNVHYQTDKKYEWYYKDGIYEEEIIND